MLIDGAVACGSGHYWLDMLDGNILDPTASQFKRPNGKRMPQIYHGPKPEWYHVYDHGSSIGGALGIALLHAKSKFPESVSTSQKLHHIYRHLCGE